MRIEIAAELLLMYGVVPLWIAAGLADWWCHRRTRIESTSGWPENVFHWILLGEAGVALVAVTLLEINAAVLMLVLAAFLAHEITTYIELRYAVPLREVRPAEQMIHSFMEILPLVMLAVLALMQWDQVLALFDAGEPDFALRPKGQPWPAGYLLGATAAVLVFNVLPMAEEGIRCLRARQDL
jgi:hypothetical protein